MFGNVENPFGIDAFTAPPADLRHPAPRVKKPRRKLPAAPSLKDLTIKLITL
jgi:hypothetical protein